MANTEDKPHFILTVMLDGGEISTECDISGTNSLLVAMMEQGVSHALYNLYEAIGQEDLIEFIIFNIVSNVHDKITRSKGVSYDATRTH